MDGPTEERDVKNIGKNLYITRKEEMKKTQEEFAEMINMSKDTVSNIERGVVVSKRFNKECRTDVKKG